MSKQLKITVVQAQISASSVSLQSINAYCQVSIDSQKNTTKPSVKSGAQPIWKEEQIFQIDEIKNQQIEIQILYDQQDVEEELGVGQIQLKQFFNNQNKNPWIDLHLKGKQVGKIQLEAQLVDVAQVQVQKQVTLKINQINIKLNRETVVNNAVFCFLRFGEQQITTIAQKLNNNEQNWNQSYNLVGSNTNQVIAEVNSGDCEHFINIGIAKFSMIQQFDKEIIIESAIEQNSQKVGVVKLQITLEQLKDNQSTQENLKLVKQVVVQQLNCTFNQELDVLNQCQPFSIVRLNGQIKKSNVGQLLNQNNIKLNDLMIFNLTSESNTLQIDICDDDPTQQIIIGSSNLEFKQNLLRQNELMQMESKLVFKEKIIGQLSISIELKQFKENQQQFISQIPNQLNDKDSAIQQIQQPFNSKLFQGPLVDNEGAKKIAQILFSSYDNGNKGHMNTNDIKSFMTDSLQTFSKDANNIKAEDISIYQKIMDQDNDGKITQRDLELICLKYLSSNLGD